MNLLQKLRPTRTTPPPVQMSERDRVAAEIAHEQERLSETEFLVSIRRQPQEVLDDAHQRIANLQSTLQALDVEEAEIMRIQEACSTELPAAEAALAAEVQSFVNDLLRLQAKARTIQEQRTTIIDRFADFKRRQLHGQVKVPMRNRELLPLTGGGLVEAFTDTYGRVALFLKEAREAGFTVPKDEPMKTAPARQRPAPTPEPMSPQERRVRKATGSLS